MVKRAVRTLSGSGRWPAWACGSLLSLWAMGCGETPETPETTSAEIDAWQGHEVADIDVGQTEVVPNRDVTQTDIAPDYEVTDIEVADSDVAETVVVPGREVAQSGCPPAGPDADFFDFVAELPADNGTLIRCEHLNADQPDAPHRLLRVLYRTSTLLHYNGGVDVEHGVVASGQVIIPNASDAQMAGGPVDRVVIANTHGATGVIPSCGPSRHNEREGGYRYLLEEAPDAVVVFPDYVGLGVDHGDRVAEVDHRVTWPDGVSSAPFSNITHPFASIESEGRATLDLVRAVRALANLPDSPRVIALGQSQGGHAAIATAEVHARGYGDTLNLLGVVAGAPASELDTTAWWSTEFENAVFGMMAASLPLEFRDIRASRFLSNEGMMMISDVSNRICFRAETLLETLAKFNVVPRMFKVDPWQDDQVLAALSANSPGRATIEVPMFIGQVRGDPLVLHQRTQSFVSKARARNPGLISFCEYSGASPSLPALLRAENHDAFKAMFARTAQDDGTQAAVPAQYGCTDGGSPDHANDPRTFVRQLLAASR